jgi:secondary thiamine-phosphate synthase enzyme
MDITVKTSAKTEMLDITRPITEAVEKEGVRDGACLVYVPHTTAAVTINEAADPEVARDILVALDRMVPGDAPFRHAEGNSPAHVKASLLGASALIAVNNGRLALGTWQGVFFCEFDGPRTRKVQLKFL